MGEETNEDRENVSLLKEKYGNNNIEDGHKHRVKSFIRTISNFVGKLTKEKVTDEVNKDQDKASLLETGIDEKDSFSNDDKDSLLESKRNFKDKLRGTFVAFLVVLKYTASGVSVQLLERRIPDLELNAIRNGGACILYLAVLSLRRRYPYVPRKISFILWLQLYAVR